MYAACLLFVQSALESVVIALVLPFGVKTLKSLCLVFVADCTMPGEAGRAARLYCPETCGCNDRFSSQIYIHHELGCPKTCDAQCKEQHKQQECADTPADDPEFQRWVSNFFEMAKKSSYQGVFTPYVASMQSDVCATLNSSKVPRQMVEMVCGGLHGAVKGASVFCPVTCEDKTACSEEKLKARGQ